MYRPPAPIARLTRKTPIATGIAQQPRRKGAVKPTYVSINRSHAFRGAADGGAHVPPTQVHCWSQELTVRWVMSTRIASGLGDRLSDRCDLCLHQLVQLEFANDVRRPGWHVRPYCWPSRSCQRRTSLICSTHSRADC